MVPRRKLEAAATLGVGLAYAGMWLPSWGDVCPDDPACSPVGDMRIVPDPAATRTLPWMPSHATALVTMCNPSSQPPATPWLCCPRSGAPNALPLLMLLLRSLGPAAC